MQKTLNIALCVISYILASVSSLYLIPFVGGFWVDKHIDSGEPSSCAWVCNLGLLVLFGFQHSLMARPGVKKHITRFVPNHLERSVYIIASSLILLALFYFWSPLPETIWDIHSPLLRKLMWAGFTLGWVVMLQSANMIDYMDFMGIKQVVHAIQNKPYQEPEFKVTGFYRYLRHPQMVGFLLGFWVTPHMSQGHLLFASIMSIYIFISNYFEERNLIEKHGHKYLDYKKQIPGFWPTLKPYKNQ